MKKLLLILLGSFLVHCRTDMESLLMERVKKGLGHKEAARKTEDVKKIKFLLRDRSKSDWIPLNANDPIPEGAWVPGGDTKLIIHGYSPQDWLSSKERIAWQGIFELGIAYSKKNVTFNVFVLDWTVLSTQNLKRYYEASQATRFVGEAAAKFLIRLHKQSYIREWDSIHAIGFSLGDHAVGVVGAKTQELAGVEIGRITGLDPGPAFDINGDKLPDDLSGFLDAGDAKFVDVIHCNLKNANQTFIGHLGSSVQAGHADFYPDGGEYQTECSTVKDPMKVCSHLKCMEYMKKPLKEDLVACPCKDWETYSQGKCSCELGSGGVLMGDRCPSSASGKYFMRMN